MAERESTDLLDVSSYEGGNMLNSEIFRTTDVRRQSANLGMREGKAFGQRYSLEQGPCRFGFHVPTDDEREEVIDIIETLELTESIHETLLLPKSGKKQNLSSVLEDGEKGYYLSRNPNSDGTANVFAPSESTPSILQMAIRNAISVRGFRNRPVVPTTAWTKMGNDAPRLPRQYQEVEYIQSSGTQYIDTGFAYSKDTGQIKTKFMSTAFGSQYHTYRLGGSYNSASPTSRSFILYVNFGSLYLGLGTGDINTSRSMSVNTIYELEETITTAGTCSVKLNGETTSHTYSGTIATNKNFYIFCNNESGGAGSFGRGRLYYLELYEEGEIKRNFVPCYRVGDGAVGLYDLVEGMFYVNSGTGTFLIGKSVRVPHMPEGYTELSYLESSGNGDTSGQYIDTGYCPNNNTEIELGMSNWTNPVGSYQLFGQDIGFVEGDKGTTVVTKNYSWNGPNSTEFDHGFRDGNAHLLLLNNSGLWKDGTIIHNGRAGQTFQSSTTLSVFCLHRGDTYRERSAYRLFHMRIRESGELERDYVPCKRDSDGVVGLYDLVNKQFLTNQGTGDFVAGRNVVRGGFAPGEDTIAYYPLTSVTNISDQSGHGYDLTNGGMVSFGTNYGVNCGYFSSGGTGSGNAGLYRTNSDIVSFGNNYTWLVWLYKGSESMFYNPRIVGAYNGAIFTYAALNKISVADSTSYGIEPSNGEWFLFTATYDGTTFKFYKNGVYQNSASYSRGTHPTTGIVIGTRDNLGTGYGDKWSGGMSEMIVEKKLWSDDEIISYFNYVKKRYGLI